MRIRGKIGLSNLYGLNFRTNYVVNGVLLNNVRNIVFSSVKSYRFFPYR